MDEHVCEEAPCLVATRGVEDKRRVEGCAWGSGDTADLGDGIGNEDGDLEKEEGNEDIKNVCVIWIVWTGGGGGIRVNSWGL